MARIVEMLELSPGITEGTPGPEGAMVRDALRGLSIYEIAQQHQTSERAVWEVLGNAARAASGQPIQQVEIGSANVGVDTEDGVTGSYGDTGFGPRGDAPPPEVDAPPAEER